MKKVFFEKMLNHRREVKKIKARNKTSFNWTMFLIFLVIILLLVPLTIYVTTLFVLGSSINSLGDSFANSPSWVELGKQIGNNPELGMVVLTEDSRHQYELTGLTLLKQMFVSGALDTNVVGNFEARFTTKKERTLEKIDLNCVDEYNYLAVDTNISLSVIRTQQMVDEGCTQFSADGIVSYYKCPKRNCKMREVSYEHLNDIIPTKLALSNIKLSGNVKGGK